MNIEKQRKETRMKLLDKLFGKFIENAVKAKIEEIKALETIEEVQTWLDTQLAVGWD